MKEKFVYLLAVFLLLSAVVSGCGVQNTAGSSMDTDEKVQIDLSDNGITIKGKGAAAEGSVVTITEKGTYILSGSLGNGQIIVDSDSSAKVWLVLNGIDVTCADSAAIYVAQADKVYLILEDGTENYVADGVEDDRKGQQAELTSAIYSKDDLIIQGKGSLTVCGNYKHGVLSKDSLVIEGGNITVKAVKNALDGKDNVSLASGSIELDAENDGINSTGDITIEGDCALTIRAGDDAIHGDLQVLIKGGNITIEKSYEGIEGSRIFIEDGRICLTADDDGINASGDNSKITISGGYLLVNASGDGIDSNGDLEINGGEVYINGPTSNGDAAIDYGERSSAIVNGGIIAAAGSSSMASSMSAGSQQCSILAFMENKIAAGVEISLKDVSGNVILSWTPDKEWQSIILSHPDIVTGETYVLSVGKIVVEVVQDSQVTTYGRGGMPGNFHGGMPDDFHGGMSGDFNGDMPGDFNGDMPGDFHGGMPGDFNGDMPEGFREQMPQGEVPDDMNKGENGRKPWKTDDIPSVKTE